MSSVSIPCSSTQREFVYAVLSDDSVDIVGFGGARGGGKTFISALVMVLRRLKYPGTRGLFIRRTQSAADQSLKSEIEKVIALLGIPAGAVRYKINDRLFVFPNGSTILLGYCKLEEDYARYMGVEYADIAWEELTQHEKSKWDLVNGSNRSNHPACKPKIWATMNPGGIGHAWVRELFVDNPTRANNVRFIQSLIFNNLAQLENDPGYARRVLDPLPEWQRRQWRDGSWDAVCGQYFEVPPDQVCDQEIPYWATWTGGVDWGRHSPFACLFAARWRDQTGRDHLHIEGEVYKTGLHLDEQAALVNDTEAALRRKHHFDSVLYFADPSVAKPLEGEATEAGRTIRSTWATNNFFVLPAHSRARVPGWQLLRYLLYKGILTISPSCMALLSELRSAVYEGTTGSGEPSGEDIDPKCRDHALDSLRYLCVSTFGLGYTENPRSPYEHVFSSQK